MTLERAKFPVKAQHFPNIFQDFKCLLPTLPAAYSPVLRAISQELLLNLKRSRILAVFSFLMAIGNILAD